MIADPSGGIEVLEWSSVKNKAPVALAPNKHLLVVPKSTCQLACKKARKHQVSTLAIWRNCGGRRLQRRQLVSFMPILNAVNTHKSQPDSRGEG